MSQQDNYSVDDIKIYKDLFDQIVIANKGVDEKTAILYRILSKKYEGFDKLSFVIDKYEAIKQNSVPMDVVMGLVDALKCSWPGEYGQTIKAHHDQALEKFEKWQKGRGDD